MSTQSCTSDSPAIGALVPWFGAKRSLAPRVVEALGEHSVYWEPACGSMAILLAKAKVSMETANDLHGDLVNLARVVQHPTEGPRFYRRLRRTLACEGLFDDAVEVLSGPCPDAMDADRAHAYFVASWLGRNGIAGTKAPSHSLCVRYTANGGQPAKRWQSAVESIPAWSRRLREVFILRRDLFEVISKIDDAPGHAIYVDPPYLPATRTGFGGAGNQSHYLHEFTLADHERLAKALNRFQHARVVASYYASPRLAELYPGWEQRSVEVSKNTANASKRDKAGATKATEVLLINRRQQRGDLLFS